VPLQEWCRKTGIRLQRACSKGCEGLKKNINALWRGLVATAAFSANQKKIDKNHLQFGEQRYSMTLYGMVYQTKTW
jgi:hypothetical protein